MTNFRSLAHFQTFNMSILVNKKAIMITAVCAAMVFAQSFAQKEHHKEEKPQNLKVLPKDISEEDLHNAMRNYSRALGVRCNYCHEGQKIEGQERMRFDFASDSKKEKDITREMIKMTADINSKYLGKIMNGKLEQITCVTCHNGNSTPNISVDSLKRDAEPAKH